MIITKIASKAKLPGAKLAAWFESQPGNEGEVIAEFQARFPWIGSDFTGFIAEEERRLYVPLQYLNMAAKHE